MRPTSGSTCVPDWVSPTISKSCRLRAPAGCRRARAGGRPRSRLACVEVSHSPARHHGGPVGAEVGAPGPLTRVSASSCRSTGQHATSRKDAERGGHGRPAASRPTLPRRANPGFADPPPSLERGIAGHHCGGYPPSRRRRADDQTHDPADEHGGCRCAAVADTACAAALRPRAVQPTWARPRLDHRVRADQRGRRSRCAEAV